MAVKLYFGLPGCGKTTLLAAFAYKDLRKGTHAHVYSNVPLAIPGVTYIDNDVIGKYNLENALVLIDEGTLFADNRGHKTFSKELTAFFLLHRHYNCDIIIFTQQWDGVDKKIRVITDRVYYVYKGVFLGHWFSSYYRIPYGIIIPDPKRNDSQKLGEIVQGYCKPNILIRMFSPKLFRPKYYKYFDSWERPPLPALPNRYRPYSQIKDGEVIDSVRKPGLWDKTCILLRWLDPKNRSRPNGLTNAYGRFRSHKIRVLFRLPSAVPPFQV